MGEVAITISFGDAAKGARDLIDTANTGKKAKSDVAYQDAPHDGAACRVCKSWEGSDQDTEAPCKIVGGEVEAGATCDCFEERENLTDEDKGAPPPPFEKKVPPPGGVSDQGEP